MTTTGVVERMEAGGAWLQVKHCNPLTVCGGGGCPSCENGREKPKLPVWAARAGEVQPGDRVEVDVMMPNLGLQILTVFGLPLLMGILVAAVGHKFAPLNYVGMIAGAVVGLFLGFVGMAWCSKSLLALRPTGRIMRVLEPASS